MDGQDQKRTQAATTVPWWKKNKGMSILSGIVIVIAIAACVWLIIHPRVYGTYNGYIDGKKEVKLVINKEGGDTKHGYFQYNSSSQTGRALNRFTKALNKNETTINEFSDYLKDSDSLDLKKMMRSDLYKEYIEKGKIPVLAVKHDGDWYLQLDRDQFTEAGFKKSDVDGIFSSISKKDKYSKENKISYSFHKFIIGTKKENIMFYRDNVKPRNPEDWANKKEARKDADKINEAADELDELASVMDTMRNVAAIGELNDLLDAMDDGDTSADDSALDDDTDTDSDSIDSDDAEDVSYVPSFQQHLVFE